MDICKPKQHSESSLAARFVHFSSVAEGRPVALSVLLAPRHSSHFMCFVHSNKARTGTQMSVVAGKEIDKIKKANRFCATHRANVCGSVSDWHEGLSLSLDASSLAAGPIRSCRMILKLLLLRASSRFLALRYVCQAFTQLYLHVAGSPGALAPWLCF
jgi:hypothetical protein